MKIIRLFVFVAFSVFVSGVVWGIKPDTTLFFYFPDLPETNYFRATAKFPTTLCSVYVPKDFCENKTIPVVLWIEGGTGGSGDHIEIVKEIFGKTGAILINFPLFKEKVDSLMPDSSNYWTRIRIRNADNDVLWTSYKTMLDTILKVFPLIDTSNAYMGGFSNGAHATAVLLNRNEHEITKYFSKYYFIEGGDGLENFSVLRNRYVFYMQGTELSYPNWVKFYFQQAKKCNAKADFVYMKGAGHNFPAGYYYKLRKWIHQTKNR